MKKEKRKKNQKGFTLIELVIVIAILAILAAVAIPNYIAVQARAEDAALKYNAGQIASAINLYNVIKSSEGGTIIVDTDLDIVDPATQSAAETTITADASDNYWPKGLSDENEAAALAIITIDSEGFATVG